MSYVRGFKELSDEEEKKFLSALGMSKERFAGARSAPRQFAYGWPQFRPKVDIWVDVYRRYAKSLDITSKAALHRSINRLFFSLKEGRFISLREHQSNREVFRENYIIPKTMKNSNEAQVWLKLAGAYTQAVIQKDNVEAGKQKAADFLQAIPLSWFNIEEARYSDADQKRAYTKFVDALSEHWSLFIDSYLNEVHGTVINNAPVAASLQSFLAGHYPDGTPLRRPHSLVYWPKPLSHYATHDTARSLFEAKKSETQALKPILSQAAGGDATIYAFPRWLRLGVDHVDPVPAPPQWKP